MKEKLVARGYRDKEGESGSTSQMTCNAEVETAVWVWTWGFSRHLNEAFLLSQQRTQNDAIAGYCRE